ncbi:MAG: DUF1015 domain-containing protein [Magnetococcales bacterium]|nr:DUF1015 domain-containing protein [Magnetococcales bacterium]
MDQAPLIQPFCGLRPLPQLVEKVAAPPYDVLNREEARKMAEGNPHSFLRVSKADIELSPDISPYDPLVYETAKANLEKMRQNGWLQKDDQACFYLYRLRQGPREQTGIVVAASVDALVSGRIKKHEFTRPDKEKDRTDHAATVQAHSGPVFLTFRHTEAIHQLFKTGTAGTPVYDFTASDSVHHTLWVIQDSTLIEELSAAFNTLPCVYIADGHHRSAASVRVRDRYAESRGGLQADDPANRFLCVLFPDDQVDILDYNRVVRDLNGLSVEAFLKRVGDRFTVTESQEPVRPGKPHEFGMFVAGQWFKLVLDGALIDENDPVARLDVGLLNVHLLDPILGIHDPRRDSRIDFVGGSRGLENLMERVGSGEMAVAFSMYPTDLQDVMAVADANQVMPPKSTWFEPKLRDGMVIQEL